MECFMSKSKSKIYWCSLETGQKTWKLDHDDEKDNYDPQKMIEKNKVNDDIKLLRTESNLAKRQLHTAHIKKNAVHLDLACGRGGDLFKIEKSNPKLYLGIDNSPGAIREALNRSQKLDMKHRMFLLDLTSEQDTSLLNEKIKKYQISSISMMFAFHYMLESQSKFENFVFFLSKISKTNHCVFYGITPNWNYIEKHAKNTSFSPCKGCTIKSCNFPDNIHKDNYTGVDYKFYVEGSVCENEDGLTEYLVFWPAVEQKLIDSGWSCEFVKPLDICNGLYVQFLFKYTGF